MNDGWCKIWPPGYCKKFGAAQDGPEQVKIWSSFIGRFRQKSSHLDWPRGVIRASKGTSPTSQLGSNRRPEMAGNLHLAKLKFQCWRVEMLFWQLWHWRYLRLEWLNWGNIPISLNESRGPHEAETACEILINYPMNFDVNYIVFSSWDGEKYEQIAAFRRRPPLLPGQAGRFCRKRFPTPSSWISCF